MTVRIALIGAGIMGADHARIFAEDIPGATLQVVCDVTMDRAKPVADQYGAKDCVTDPIEAIKRSDVDAVVIASPDQTHAPLSLVAIEEGKPVLSEKPMSQILDECQSVLDAEVSRGKQFIQLGFMRRFDPSYLEMKEALGNGDLGRAIMMHNFHRNVETPAADFTADMAITNAAPHEFDVARFVLGSEYASISTFAPKGRSDRVGPVFMVLETVDNQIVNIEVNNNAMYGYDVRAELVGENGSAILNTPVYTKFYLGLKSYEKFAADWRARFDEAYRQQNKDFLHFVNTGEFSSIAANAWDGYCSTLMAQAGVQALKEGKKVSVELPTKPELY